MMGHDPSYASNRATASNAASVATVASRTNTSSTTTAASAPSAAASTDSRHVGAADGSTFAPAMELLPAPLRKDVSRLYGVLRALDDLVDDDDPRASARIAAVESWARGARARSPEALVLASLAQRHEIRRQPLLDFCAGMRHDIARTPIRDEEDFVRYCQQAGGAVGIVLANLLGVADEATRLEAETKMAALGRAMQVTNILRDIDEDLEHDRVYISEHAIERYGFPAPGEREALLRREIARADALYEEGAGAVPLLARGREAMALAAALYREILRQIERDGFGRRAGRASISTARATRIVRAHRLTRV